MASYVYNGLGDRLEETVSGVTTRFTMDLAAGLAQALSDGTYTYLYGNGRIAQYSAGGTEYFLGDALGSVRQLAGATGAVTLAKAYQPYGSVLNSAGSSTTNYGFTGEWTDRYIELLYLRSRWHSPQSGRLSLAIRGRGIIKDPSHSTNGFIAMQILLI